MHRFIYWCIGVYIKEDFGEGFKMILGECVVCGIDEAGRGPLAGPVYASAVVFKRRNCSGFESSYTKSQCSGASSDSSSFLQLLNDSKKMSETSRVRAFEQITQESFYAVAFASHEEIDEINILQASLLAMRRAFSLLYKQLEKEAPHLLQNLTVIVDGNKIPHLTEGVSCEAMVKADAKIKEVMAASILAKVSRDRKMIEYSKLYPQWNYQKHKGYPTKAHIDAIKEHGESPIQRKSFRYRFKW